MALQSEEKVCIRTGAVLSVLLDSLDWCSTHLSLCICIFKGRQFVKGIHVQCVSSIILPFKAQHVQRRSSFLE